jgi:CPA1 family monovalent cation:H+ antiporter
VLLGILIGLVVGLAFYCIHRWLPVTPSIEIALTLITPYCMYYAAEHFHFSGVLAVVSGGLFLSGRRLSMLNYMSRIQGINVWNSVVFVLNGLVFLLIGLQLPSIVNQLGDTSLMAAIFYGLIISLVLIVARLLCTFGAAGFTIFISRYIKVADANPGWKAPLLFGWAGIRGVVSLAAALAIPLIADNGKEFPYRNLILFITFIVILVTLVLQGLTLPWFIRKLKLEDPNAIPSDEQEKIIQKKIAAASLDYLEKNFSEAGAQNERLINLKAKLKTEMDFYNGQVPVRGENNPSSGAEFHKIYLSLLEHQRTLLEQINGNVEFDEDVLRKYQFLIDMDEYKIREKFPSGEDDNG